jgi:hypothetical protein
MSSVVRAPSQVGPFKRYVATAATALYSSTGASQTTGIAANTVFADMGKTAYATAPVAPATAGAVLRKVQQLPTATSAGVVGYIYLSDAIPTAQKIAGLN